MSGSGFDVFSESRSLVKTGCSETRLFSQKESSTNKLIVGIDWYRGIASGFQSEESVLEVINYLSVNREEVLVQKDSPISMGSGSIWYSHRFQSSFGLSGGFSEKEDGTWEVLVNLSGVYFSNFDLKDIWIMLTYLTKKRHFRCCRIDLKVDDLTDGELIPVEQMFLATQNGCCKGARNYSASLSGKSKIVGDQMVKDERRTLYIGSRNSGKLGRGYHKEIEVNGKKHPVLRWEIEFKRKFAPIIVDKLLEVAFPQIFDTELCRYRDANRDVCCDIIAAQIAGLIGYAFDFRDKIKENGRIEKNLDRVERFSWYQQFIDCIGQIKFQVPTYERSVTKTLAWLPRQCFGVVSAIREGLGTEKFIRFILSVSDPDLFKKGIDWTLLRDSVKFQPSILRHCLREVNADKSTRSVSDSILQHSSLVL